MNALTFV